MTPFQKANLELVAELRQEIRDILRGTFPRMSMVYHCDVQIEDTVIDVEYEAPPEEFVRVVSATVDGADITGLADKLGLPDKVQAIHDYQHGQQGDADRAADAATEAA